MGEKNSGLGTTGNTTGEPVKKSKRFKVTFCYNRKFDLWLDRDLIEFWPDDRTKELTESQVSHPAFKQQAKYFATEEIK